MESHPRDYIDIRSTKYLATHLCLSQRNQLYNNIAGFLGYIVIRNKADVLDAIEKSTMFTAPYQQELINILEQTIPDKEITTKQDLYAIRSSLLKYIEHG